MIKAKTIQDYIVEKQSDVEFYTNRLATIEKDYEVIAQDLKDCRISLVSCEDTLKKLQSLISGEEDELIKNINPCNLPRCIWRSGQIGPCICSIRKNYAAGRSLTGDM